MANTEAVPNQGMSYDAGWEVLDAKEQAYRDALGDGIEAVLGNNAETLTAIVDWLNAMNVHGPKGVRWTEALLESELERIAR